ncbi:hypothetical protein [Sinanaerobacter chloroacetimidivorans]|jgi:hypothetical protein|uniref:Uncharacterized protein n=1 Tax=Sinanaerobacter chloroacetimidivorans TaxID=2818044 RepID=A0A8J8B0W5_9FIRM|nr:hypothetical protein [Sinanaerobacter chloroacetimidivorans]MBR0598058.1 hypothetical protein [Sinanaerobacter chloroacetimidivorans]
MRMRNTYYDDNYNDQNDEMLSVAAHCSRFSRRHDVNAFNMMDYQSCENCRHLTADNQCVAKMQNRFTNME